MNLSQLQSEIGRLLNDPNNLRWVASILTTRINIAQDEIQGFTNAVKVTETLTPLAGVQTITLNANTMDVLDGTVQDSSGNIKPLPIMSRQELDYRYSSWRQWTQGQPLLTWWDASNCQLNLVPTPDASNAVTNGITVSESRLPADLVNASDIPFDSNNQMVPYHMAIVHWVVSQCWIDDGTPEAMGKSKFHRSGDLLKPGMYESEIKRILDKFDKPTGQSSHILWQKEGGRIGAYGPSKALPLAGL